MVPGLAAQRAAGAGVIAAPIVGEDGWPVEERGVSPSVPGLYFLGVPFQYAFSSMLVAGAGRDAKFVVERIVERREVSGFV